MTSKEVRIRTILLMEALEKRKTLEKKKAYLTFLMSFIVMLMPAVFSWCYQNQVSIKTVTVLLSILMLVQIYLFLLLRKIRANLKAYVD